MRDARTITALGVSTLAAVSLTVAPARADSDVLHWNETAFAVTVPGLCKQLGWTKNVSIYKVSYYKT